MMSFFFTKMILLFFILIGVAFITLFERKILSYIQYRKGPNKVFFLGLFQPFSDALKLFSKMKLFLNFSNYMIYFFSPIFSLILMLLFWSSFSLTFSNGKTIFFEMILIMVISSFNVYSIIFSGWASNSKFSLLGSYRGIAQTISYEVSFSFFIISLFIFNFNLNFLNIHFIQKNMYFLLPYFLLFFMWFFIILAETNRTPFDLSEGESELVSGFNIEYSGVEFALIFMAEYGNIIFMSFLSSLIFFSGMSFSYLKYLNLIFLFLVIRGTLIRIRYDNLMFLAWKILLPFSILNLIFFFMNFFY